MPSQGGAETPIPINFGLTAGQEVAGLFPVLDGEYLIYRVVEPVETDSDSAAERFWLYSVPITGGEPTRLAGPEISVEQLNLDFEVPNSELILFAGARETNLQTVPVTGGTPTVISGGSALPITNYAPSVDGNYVVFAREGEGLYSASVDGDQLVNLAATPNPDSFQISADSQRVVYAVTDASVSPTRQVLYRVPIAGGEAINLLTPVNGASLCEIDESTYFSISPDSTRVVFTAQVGDETRCRLFSAGLDGTNAVELTGGDNQTVSGFQLTWDSERVVYLAEEGGAGGAAATTNLYAVSVAGGSATNLSTPLLLELDSEVPNIFSLVQLDSTSEFAAFAARAQADGPVELYSVRLLDNAKVQISGPSGDDSSGSSGGLGIQYSFRPETGGKQLVYVTEQQPGVRELYLGAFDELAAPVPNPATPTPPPASTPGPMPLSRSLYLPLVENR